MSASERKIELVVEFPREWVEGHDWALVETVFHGHEDVSGDPIWAGGGVLDDGTNLIALRWSRGTHFVRMSPETGWSLEERLAPKPPKHVRKLWRVVVESMVRGKRDAIEEVRAADERLVKAETDEEKFAAVLHHPYALQRAYKAYCEQETEPVPLETFKLGLAIVAGEA